MVEIVDIVLLVMSLALLVAKIAGCSIPWLLVFLPVALPYLLLAVAFCIGAFLHWRSKK